eukprot:scaffold22512_cov98-Skeletonema_marinoi.AAC.2
MRSNLGWPPVTRVGWNCMRKQRYLWCDRLHLPFFKQYWRLLHRQNGKRANVVGHHIFDIVPSTNHIDRTAI